MTAGPTEQGQKCGLGIVEAGEDGGGTEGGVHTVASFKIRLEERANRRYRQMRK